MRSMVLAAVVALLSGAPASLAQDRLPQAMTVENFIESWAAIKAEQEKGEQAARTARFMTAIGESFKRYKDGLDSDARAGRPPRACPAKGTRDTFQIDDLVTALDDLPQARRDGPFDPEFFDFLDRRYPCAGAVSPASPSAPAAAGKGPG